MEKTLKINVPDGYEIDKEKSTFENIVFKKKDNVVIKWNSNFGGVEINDDGEHFIIIAIKPSFCCSWDDAMRLHKNSIWTLPTIKQLRVLAKYIDKVNEVIRENDGYEIKGWTWSCEEKDTFCAWCVNMDDGSATYDLKSSFGYVRAVYTL